MAVHRAFYDRKPIGPRSLSIAWDSSLPRSTLGGSPLQRAELDIRCVSRTGFGSRTNRLASWSTAPSRIGGNLLTPEVRGTLALREGGTLELSRATLRITQGRVELEGFPARAPS